MYITINDKTYPARKPIQSKPLGVWFKIYLIDRPDITLPISGDITLRGDNGFELATIHTEDYARQSYAGAVLKLTNEPEPSETPVTHDIPQEIENSIRSMSEACHTAIINGITIGEAHYSLELEDQLNLTNLQAMIMAGATSVPYHADGEECKMYTVEEFATIGNMATLWKTFHESYFNSLREYIKSLQDVSAIWEVRYGMEIPVEYQTDVLKTLIAQNPDIDFFPVEEREVV